MEPRLSAVSTSCTACSLPRRCWSLVSPVVPVMVSHGWRWAAMPRPTAPCQRAPSGVTRQRLVEELLAGAVPLDDHAGHLDRCWSDHLRSSPSAPSKGSPATVAMPSLMDSRSRRAGLLDATGRGTTRRRRPRRRSCSGSSPYSVVVVLDELLARRGVLLVVEVGGPDHAGAVGAGGLQVAGAGTRVAEHRAGRSRPGAAGSSRSGWRHRSGGSRRRPGRCRAPG